MSGDRIARTVDGYTVDVVRHLVAMGGTWDASAQRWSFPAEKLQALSDFLDRIDANVVLGPVAEPAQNA